MHRPPQPAGPYVLIFGFDGAGYDQLMEAIASGKAPNMAAMLGKNLGGGVYEHAYSVPNAISILPSTTMAAWSAITTGAPTAYNAVSGNEWFERETMTFVAPAPVSVSETDDTRRMIADDLVGKSLKSPTLYQMAGVRSAVSLNAISRGSDVYTTVEPTAMVTIMSDFLIGNEPEEKQDVYEKLDRDSVPKLLESMDAHGIPNLQFVYFPGIDLYTHLADKPLAMEVQYLEHVTDELVGNVLDAYRKAGILDETYIVVIADHGHTPVLKDSRHALGADPSEGPAAVAEHAGFRPRKFKLTLPQNEQDFQAVFAYQGAIAYMYLADRSTCPRPGEICDWKRPPRFNEDVMPAVRAFYKANNNFKNPANRMAGTIDLIFARRPSPAGKDATEFQIFDGTQLVPIWKYLILHPRPDLVELDRRMRWLSMGPWGNRAGDVLFLAHSGMNLPLQKRYYFSGPYHSWHGSASEQDGHIPLIVARSNYSGAQLKAQVVKVTGTAHRPSQLDMVPIVMSLLKSAPAPAAASPSAAVPSATHAEKSR